MPRCDHARLHRSRRSALETLAGLVFLRPFRCVDCGKRVWRFRAASLSELVPLLRLFVRRAAGDWSLLLARARGVGSRHVSAKQGGKPGVADRAVTALASSSGEATTSNRSVSPPVAAPDPAASGVDQSVEAPALDVVGQAVEPVVAEAKRDDEVEDPSEAAGAAENLAVAGNPIALSQSPEVPVQLQQVEGRLLEDGSYLLELRHSAEALVPASFLLQSPARLVLDLPGQWCDFDGVIPGRREYDVGPVQRIRLGRPGGRLRVLVELGAGEDFHYDIAATAGRLCVSMRNGAT